MRHHPPRQLRENIPAALACLCLLAISGLFACARKGGINQDHRQRAFLPESGIISRDTVWSGTMIIDRDVLVLPGTTLTVKPGTKVLFRPTKNSLIAPRFLFTKHELLIRGRLLAEGKKNAPVFFSGAEDKEKAPQWAGIIIDTPQGEVSLIRNCVIKDAEQGVYCIGASPQIWESRFLNNESSIICQHNSHPQIKDNILTGGEVGIACWDKAVPIIKGNEITGHKHAAVVWAYASPWLENNLIRGNKYGLYGTEPLIWSNNRIEDNERDFYLSDETAGSEPENNNGFPESVQERPEDAGERLSEPELSKNKGDHEADVL